MRMRVQLGCGGSWWSTRRGAAGYSSIVSGAPSLPHPPPGMEVCSLPLLQQLSLKGRELDACCSDEDCEQVFKARRYSGIYSPSKALNRSEAVRHKPIKRSQCLVGLVAFVPCQKVLKSTVWLLALGTTVTWADGGGWQAACGGGTWLSPRSRQQGVRSCSASSQCGGSSATARWVRTVSPQSKRSSLRSRLCCMFHADR